MNGAWYPCRLVAKILDDRHGCRDYADRFGPSSSLRVAEYVAIIAARFSTTSVPNEAEFDAAAKRSHQVDGEEGVAELRDVDQKKGKREDRTDPPASITED
jgi:hypothetical protein